jgi:dephospho-CoA kinase
MGSGKSTAARRVAQVFGYDLIDADKEAKTLMQQDDAIRARLRRVFGARIMTPSDTIDYAALGAVVFTSFEMLQRLNRIVHPPLLQRLYRCVRESEHAGVVLDAALIPLWGIEAWFHTCIWIEAPRHVRMARMAQKSTGGRETVRVRCAMQEALFAPPARSEEQSRASWRFLRNDGPVGTLYSRIEEIVTCTEEVI